MNVAGCRLQSSAFSERHGCCDVTQ